MYLPAIDSSFADPLVDSSGKKHASTGDWSSLIGVVTAICGNILISFALNTQRYAHLRLARAADAQRKAAKRKSPRNSRILSYGTNPGATNGATHNDKRIVGESAIPEEDETERQPLLDGAGTPRKSSGSSEETLRPDEKDEEEVKEKTYLKSPIWWLGISMMVVGEAGNFLAYGFAPASIVSPLGVVALISNCLIAPLLLGEKFRWRDGLGVLIAIAGCVVVVLSASESNPKLTPDAIWKLVSRWEFETYLGITLFLIIALVVGSNKFGDQTLLIDLGLVGLFGAYTALSTKGVASLLAYNIWRVVTFPITYILVAVLVFTAIMQIKYVNRALQRFNATMVIPTQFVMFTISVIIGSAVLYRDFETQTMADGAKFIAGCALTFFGVWCITSGRGEESDDDYESDSDEDEEAALIEEDSGLLKDVQGTPDATGARPIRRLHTTGEITSGSLGRSTSSVQTIVPITPKSPEGTLPNLKNPYVDIAPANSTAVHMESGGRVTPPEATSELSSKPVFHATTSEPTIPTISTPSASALRPKTPLARAPSTPTRAPPGQSTPAQSLSRSTGAYLNPNVAGLLPGPLTSPLSGSLSAIVADELRRNSGNTGGGTLRRKKSQYAAATIPGPGAPSSRPKRHSIASVTEADFPRETVFADPSSESLPLQESSTSRPARGIGRMRSLSATIGDLFGSVGRRKGSVATGASGAPNEGGAESRNNSDSGHLQPPAA